jgi:DNA polymerase-3 subunit epsilon
MNYAIIDIETSGFRHIENKITEISIFLHDGHSIIDEFTTLVNPENIIPSAITSLTGITNEMVRDAPRFHEIAHTIESKTKDAIFVAHSVNFDYGVISKEFKELGAKFQRPKLCTVRLSRKVFPGYSSYSLGNLCSSLGIEIQNRHRARGDARATVELFEKILHHDPEKKVIQYFLNKRHFQGTLPPLVDTSEIENLPTTSGVYYFKNKEGKIIYVGKAKDIKSRVLSHFRDKSSKEQRMSLQTAKVEYTLTGGELIALLVESAEIKKHYPLFNRAQKRVSESVALTTYTDKRGVLRLCFGKLKLANEPIAKFYSERQVRLCLDKLIEEFELCPKFCEIEKVKTGACFSHQLKKCKGVCCGKEDVSDYNKRVQKAIESLSLSSETFIIQTEGREENEKGIVLLEKGIYKGYGFVKKDQKLNSLKKVKSIITSQKENSDIYKVLRFYMSHFEDYQIIPL